MSTADHISTSLSEGFDFYPTTRVLFGNGVLHRLSDCLEANWEKVLLVTDPGIVAAGHARIVEDLLRGVGRTVCTFDSVFENPTTTLVDAGVAFARETAIPDVIIALGGGSAMDTAKGINFLLSNGGQMRDYWGVGKAHLPMLPSVGIPTTAGTGSEAQSFALISDAQTHQKMACGDVKARFTRVLLDPNLLLTVPRSVAAVTGIDALSHALESYVCTRSNAVSRLFSREAWRLLAVHFPEVLADPNNLDAWGKMMVGANFAGMAIENAMLGAAHAAANPLTARLDIVHGQAVGVMLPHVVVCNWEVAGDGYRELMNLAGIPGESASDLADFLTGLCEKAGLKVNLSSLGVDESLLMPLAGEAAQQWTANFNPRAMNAGDFENLYRSAWS